MSRALRWPRLRCLVMALAAITGPATAAAEKAAKDVEPAGVEAAFRVSYVSGARVYVDGGRTRGLAEGAMLELRRDGVVVATLVVDFVAEHSASCRLADGSAAPVPGDRAVLAAPATSTAAATTTVPAATTAARLESQEAPGDTGAEPTAVGDTAAQTTPRGAPPGSEPSPEPASRYSARPHTWGQQASGSFILGWRGFSDAGPYDRGWSEDGARFNLRLLDVAQSPVSVRARLRRREIDRDRDWSDRNPSSESDDRLYELSLVYEKPEGRTILHVGRLGASPFVGLGTFDGGLAQVRVSRHTSVGGFYGSAADVEELGFESFGEKYGAYARYSSLPPGEASRSKIVSDVMVGFVGEYDAGEVSRQYVAIESRVLNGSRWHLFERAEIDLQSGWRQEVTGQSSQLSSLTLSSSVVLTPSVRLLASYDQIRPYRDADSRDTPEELFDDLLREGLRVGVSFGGARGLRGSTMLGTRRQQQGVGSTYSLQNTLLYSARSRLFYGLDLSGWGGDVSDGYLASAHVGRAFAGGHDVRLTLGHSSTTAAIESAAHVADWVRIGGRFDLPAGLYIYGEAELLSGDDREGERFLLDLGYRF